VVDEDTLVVNITQQISQEALDAEMAEAEAEAGIEHEEPGEAEGAEGAEAAAAGDAEGEKAESEDA
jgi:large subunit ribosomal protein L25